MVAERVRVETGARLHLGFYRPCRRAGRFLGGLGIGIEAAGLHTRVYAERSHTLTVEAPTECLDDAERAAHEASMRLRARGARVVVEECLPRHVGLGSTTQLVLAVYAAIAALHQRSIEEAARLAARGPYSGVGTGVFLRGGLVIDAGVSVGERAAPAAYAPVPPDWGLVVIVPIVEGSRLVPEGPTESSLLDRVRGVDQRLCLQGYVALLDMVLPGAAEADFDLFVSGLEVIEEVTGRAFASTQGGSMCCEESFRAALLLRSLGARAVGQSSWGPSVYGFFPTRAAAAAAAARARSLMRANGLRGRLHVAVPRLRGADIRLL